MSRPVSGAVLLLALICALSGCGDDTDGPGVSAESFAAVMVERYGASGEQAECITGYVFEDYDASEIEVLASDEGMGALPQARWEPYLNASAACLTSDRPGDAEES